MRKNSHENKIEFYSLWNYLIFRKFMIIEVMMKNMTFNYFIIGKRITYTKERERVHKRSIFSHINILPYHGRTRRWSMANLAFFLMFSCRPFCERISVISTEISQSSSLQPLFHLALDSFKLSSELIYAFVAEFPFSMSFQMQCNPKSLNGHLLERVLSQKIWTLRKTMTLLSLLSKNIVIM